MVSTQPGVVLRHLHRLISEKEACAVPDQHLLDRFTQRREEAAFEALVRRHGPLVWGVCRRVLHDWHDAEDAFQATFLVLARKAGAVGRRASVGSWLYRVAYHMALKARKQAMNRRKREKRLAVRDESDPLAEVTGRELLAVLDEELQRLPERQRAPLVLCYLEGQTRDAAARRLGCSTSTLKRRLEVGKARLHARLARRGVALSAALVAAALTRTATAAVPGVLVGSTARAALGWTASAGAGALADVTLRTMGAGKAKIAAALVLVLGLTALGVGALGRGAAAPAGAEASNLAAPTADKQPARPAKPGPAAPEPGEQVTLTGRVVDAQDRPVAGAQVGVLGQTVRPYKDKDLHTTDPDSALWPYPLLGNVKAGADGRFRLTFPRSQVPRWLKPAEAAVIGLAPGHALGWEGVEIKGEATEVVLRLGAEGFIRGRLFDLQGLPAAGVKVHLLKAAQDRAGTFTGLLFARPLADAPYWPPPVTTDADGRFVLRGVNRAMALALWVQDERFATDDVSVEPFAKGDVSHVLTPPRIFEGRVIAEDTRQPVPGVGVHVVARSQHAPQFRSLFARSDKDGRFRINHYAADEYYANTDDVEGQPYFAINHEEVPWPDKLKTKQALELVLPHGMLQSGKIVDAATGKPVAEANVLYLPRLFNNPQLKVKAGIDLWTHQIGRARTKADGTFQVPVLPGPGHLQIHGPWGGTEYVTYTRTRKEIFGHDRVGGQWPAHGFAKLDIKPDAKPDEVTVKLLPGVTIQGQLLGPDGKPVAKARLAARSLTPDPHRETGITEEHGDKGLQLGPTLHVKDGQFRVPGCDAGMDYRAYVLDEDSHRAATLALSGKDVTPKPLTLRWQPSASATARFVDEEGKPIQRAVVLVYVREDLRPDQPGSAVMYRPAPFLDVIVAEGAGPAALKDLIPGVCYVLLQADGKELKEFTPEPGQKIDLGAITLDPRK